MWAQGENVPNSGSFLKTVVSNGSIVLEDAQRAKSIKS